jgi:hypothetical protein
MEETTDEPFSILPKPIMSVPRISIRNFLARSKPALRHSAERGTKATLVIGNESAGTSIPSVCESAP